VCTVVYSFTGDPDDPSQNCSVDFAYQPPARDGFFQVGTEVTVLVTCTPPVGGTPGEVTPEGGTPEGGTPEGGTSGSGTSEEAGPEGQTGEGSAGGAEVPSGESGG
jgi:hypothetical protein